MHGSMSIKPVMGLHLVPVEAVDILTLIFKIHFNIIFLLLLACYKSSLLLRLYGFNSFGRWRCDLGGGVVFLGGGVVFLDVCFPHPSPEETATSQKT